MPILRADAKVEQKLRVDRSLMRITNIIDEEILQRIDSIPSFEKPHADSHGSDEVYEDSMISSLPECDIPEKRDCELLEGLSGLTCIITTSPVLIAHKKKETRLQEMLEQLKAKPVLKYPQAPDQESYSHGNLVPIRTRNLE